MQRERGGEETLEGLGRGGGGRGGGSLRNEKRPRIFLTLGVFSCDRHDLLISNYLEEKHRFDTCNFTRHCSKLLHSPYVHINVQVDDYSGFDGGFALSTANPHAYSSLPVSIVQPLNNAPFKCPLS